MDYFIENSLKRQLLIAMPGLADPNFSRTVTCICEHTAEGTVGIGINRTHPDLLCRDIFEELKIRYTPESGRLPIHLGGPVHVDEVFVLHGPPFGWDGCLEISRSLALSNTLDILEAIAEGRGPDSLMISLGCAGWGPLQLEAEIKQNVWLTCPLKKEILFDTSVESRWEEAVRIIGIDPALLSDTAGHA